MIEVIIIVALLALLGWERYQGRLERAKMLNALTAKNNQEQVNLDMADKTKIILKDKKEIAEPELVHESQIDNDTFNKNIKNILGRD